MIERGKPSTEELYRVFCQLPYAEKVILYDHSFGILHFDYEYLDLKLSWYSDSSKLERLTQNFAEDRKGGHLLTRKVEFSDSTFVFDIRPLSAAQRLHLNQYILKNTLPLFIQLLPVLRKSWQRVHNPSNIYKKK